MTEQEKREKVINGLECCLGDTRADLPNLCTICPYAHGSYATQTCGKKLREDALALLKAQESETSDVPKPDSDIGCWYDITHNYTLEQVVSALKVQEPRVVTWDELIATDHVYIETNLDGQKIYSARYRDDCP